LFSFFVEARLLAVISFALKPLRGEYRVYFDTHAAIFDLGLERQGEHSGQFTS